MLQHSQIEQKLKYATRFDEFYALRSGCRL